MNDILFLDSPLKEKLYGGTRIQEQFGFDDQMDKKIGEYWMISAHDNGPSIVNNGDYAGQSLKDVYANHRELFANDTHEQFPLLIKINEVQDPTSVQVHPDDDYGRKYENDSGKAEFCLWLDVNEGTNIIRGHTAKTKEEFRELAENQDWDTLLVRKPVHSGEFVYTPAGIVHGIEGQLMMAEVQQSSDATYRIYDYDRKDADGNLRDLHLDKAIDVTCIPHKEPDVKPVERDVDGNHIIEYVDTPFFKVTRVNVKNSISFSNPTYTCISVLSGTGTINGQELKPGMGCIVTSECKDYTLSGDMDILISQPPKQ